MAITLMEVNRFARSDLKRYNTIILVNGSYSRIGNVSKLKNWVKDGGNLIVIRGAVNWAKSNGLANVQYKSSKKKNKKSNTRRPYNKRSSDRGAQVIGGAIFEAEADLSHPLCYGYRSTRIPIFRRGTLFMDMGKNPYSTPLVYTKDPLLSGYISKENLALIKNSASTLVNRMGSGQVICMADNPNFRAFWYGTNKLFANAIFFGSTIHSQAMESEPPGPSSKKE